YSPLPLFLWQRAKPALTFRDAAFAKLYEATKEEYGYEKTKSISGLISLESARLLWDWFVYVGPPLSFPVLLGFLASVRQPRLRIAVLAALSTALALALCIYTLPHYAAPATVAVYIFAVAGLHYLWQQQK